MNITIIGQGEIGVALVKVLSDFDVRTWDADEKKEMSDKTCEDAVSEANVIFVAIPSWALSEALPVIRDNAPGDAFVVAVTKGINSGKFVSELLQDHFGSERVALLSGPMLAEELMQGMRTIAVIAGDKEVFDAVSPIFEKSIIEVEHSTDIHGVSAAGVLKNVYAIGLGIAEGSGCGSDFTGSYVSAAIEEMRKAVVALSGDSETVMGPAGIGDLVATSTSSYSKNHSIGKALAEGKEVGKSEGVVSIDALVERLGGADDYPLLNTIRKTLKGDIETGKFCVSVI